MRESASAHALVLERPRRLVLHEISLPAVGDDDALVRVQACGLCGTDHEQYTGELAGGFAFVPGHETVIIETIGTAWATTLPSVFLRSSRKGSRIVTSSGSKRSNTMPSQLMYGVDGISSTTARRRRCC